ncbi:MAG: 50S ribosomal protein L11 methyltransferase [Clostridiales bacterium]|jgi:ribosomal protein L11 methyltransferase|nr:50S ribosomal protein L11 methyltransferase [Clostridiales bacterium]
MQDRQYKISISTTRQNIDVLSGLLWELGTTGVLIIDKDIGDLSYDYLDSSLDMTESDEAVVSGFFDYDALTDVQSMLNDWQHKCEWQVGTLELGLEIVDPNQWVEDFRDSFVPVDYGQVVVVPEWVVTEYTKPVVRLQLASAFGTGKHETTSMCIKALQKYVQPGLSVADVGCGSGILGLVALLLGAGLVSFSDVDGGAISTTRYNLDINNIDSKYYTIDQRSFLDGDSINYHIVVANLTADLLTKLSSTVHNNLKPNGILILSGIILDKVDLVKDTYIDCNCQLIDQTIEGEWACLVFGIDT